MQLLLFADVDQGQRFFAQMHDSRRSAYPYVRRTVSLIDSIMHF